MQTSHTSWPTSRRYPRTLAEAFPADPRGAFAIEVHRTARTADRVMLALALVFVLLCTLGVLL